MKFSMLSVLELLCAKISITTLFLMALVTFIDVVGRVAFNSPLGFSYELVGIFLGIAFYSGLYHVHKKSKHIRIDLLEGLYKGPFGKVVFWFGYLVEIVFFSVLVYMVIQQTLDTRMFGEKFMFLGFEKWWALLAMSVLAVIAAISLLVTMPSFERTGAQVQED